MKRGWRVEYFNTHRKVWVGIRGYVYDTKEEADKKAELCKRGFGKTRVCGFISTK